MDNSIPKGCKPFDLEKAMAGEPVVTRDGRPYKFGAYNPDAKSPYKIIGWLNREHTSHSEDGIFYPDRRTCINDLFMAAKMQKVWVNLWRSHSGTLISTSNLTEEKQAADLDDKGGFTLIKTIETEVEL